MSKDEVVQALAEHTSLNVDFSFVDERLQTYIEHNTQHPEQHNKYELLSVLRFLNFSEKYELRKGKVKQFIKFYEALKFAGKKGRQSYKLTPIQVFQFANILGWYHPGTEKRVVRDVLLFVPRKYSKTTSVSSLALFDLLFGDANSQAYVGANSFNQAEICFKEIRTCLSAIDPKMKHFKQNRTTIYSAIEGKTSMVKCLHANADNLDGLNASLVIMDEYSQAISASLKNVLTSSMGVRDNPLVITITTASSKFDTPFTRELEVYKRILENEIENDEVFAHIFQLDEDDFEGDPDVWHKVQPHLGVTVNLDFYHSEWKKAQENSDKMSEFMCKYLNVFTQNANEKWLPMQSVSPLMKVLDYKNNRFQNMPCVVSFDLSVRDDFSAVTYMLYDPDEKHFYSFTDYYLPEGIIENHANRDLYLEAIEKGDLKIAGKDVIDYEVIYNDIVEHADYLCIRKIGYDQYKSRDMINYFGKKSSLLTTVRQTLMEFNVATEGMELAVYNKQITFQRNILTSFCFDNAIIMTDRLGNKKPDKSSYNKKIDGVITNLMCLKVFYEN